MARIGKIRKISGSRGGKHLGNRVLVHGWQVGVVKKEITAHVLPVAFSCLLRPLVILRGMIHHKVHADIDSLFVAGRRQSFEILHGSQLFLHLTEIGHRIAAVGASLRRLKKGHQVYVIHVAFLNIIKSGLDALHVSCKIVYVKHHSQHIVLFVPAALLLAP